MLSSIQPGQASPTSASGDEWDDTLTHIARLLGLSITRETHAARVGEFQILKAWIKKTLPHVPLSEIKLAYELAIEGVTDVEVIVSIAPVQFGKIWTAYREYKTNHDDLRKTLQAEQIRAERATSAALPSGEMDPETIMRHSLDYALHRIRTDRDFEDPGNALYDWLTAKRILALSDAQKWDCMAWAKSNMVSLLARDACTPGLNEFARAGSKKLLALAMTGEQTDALYARAVTLAKWKALDDQLRAWVQEGRTVEILLNDAL